MFLVFTSLILKLHWLLLFLDNERRGAPKGKGEKLDKRKVNYFIFS